MTWNGASQVPRCVNRMWSAKTPSSPESVPVTMSQSLDRILLILKADGVFGSHSQRSVEQPPNRDLLGSADSKEDSPRAGSIAGEVRAGVHAVAEARAFLRAMRAAAENCIVPDKRETNSLPSVLQLSREQWISSSSEGRDQCSLALRNVLTVERQSHRVNDGYGRRFTNQRPMATVRVISVITPTSSSGRK